MAKHTDDCGVLYVVATPIGNLDDFTFRGVEILRGVDCILCEDTRTSAVLLARYRIGARTESLHRYNEARKCAALVARLARGERAALLSDAGTPAVRDAGRLLAAAAHARGVRVAPLPGASAALAALSCAGFDADRFVFEGFLPAPSAARRARLRAFARERRTMIFFEAPHRIAALLEDAGEAFGEDRQVCLAKEMTKVHEAVVRGVVADVRRWLAADALRGKGEFVLLVAGANAAPEEEITVSAQELLRRLARHLPPGVAAGVVSELSGLARNRLYRQTLERDD